MIRQKTDISNDRSDKEALCYKNSSRQNPKSQDQNALSPSKGLLAARLRQLRLQHHYTQRFIAQQLDLSSQAYGYYERGLRKPTPYILAVLGKLYQINIMELLELQLMDSNPDLLPCLVHDSAQPYGSPSYASLKPDHIYEQLTLQEYQVIRYFRELPASIRHDIFSVASRKTKRLP